MKFGVFGINMGACAHPRTAVRVAQAAEAGGLDSVWTGEHVVLPDPQAPPSPVPAEVPFLDPAVALAFIAGQTRSIRLATGIIILPQRNPLVLAKELGSVDVASGGRLIFGLGVGYLKQEFDALGIPFDRKGARANEYLEAILALWTQAHPSYDGEFVHFGGVQAFPRPVQRPHPPIVVGGSTTPAFRRAVMHGNGWYGFALDAETTRRFVGELRAIEARGTRPGELGPLEVSVTPAAKIEVETVHAYAEIGVDRLIFLASITSEEKALASVRKIAAVREQFERER